MFRNESRNRNHPIGCHAGGGKTVDIRRHQRLGFHRSHGRRRTGRSCGRLAYGSMVAQSAAQAVDGYAGLGALVRHQSEICQVAFSERPNHLRHCRLRKANAISTICVFLLLLTYGRRASGIPAWPAQVLMYDTEPTCGRRPNTVVMLSVSERNGECPRRQTLPTLWAP